MDPPAYPNASVQVDHSGQEGRWPNFFYSPPTFLAVQYAIYIPLQTSTGLGLATHESQQLLSDRSCHTVEQSA